MLEYMSNQFNTTCILDDEYIVFEYNNFTFFNFIKLIFCLFTGSFLAFIFVSFFLYYPAKIKFDKLYEANKELYEYNPFLMSCLDEYYELDEDKDDDYLKTLVDKYLYYTIDFRDKEYKIVINYNFLDESFDYYLNNKSHVLPFEFLDTISRIYCVNYNCRNIYIDNFDNKEKLLDSLDVFKKEKEKDKEKEKEKEKEKDKDKDKDELKDEAKNTIFYSKNNINNHSKNKIIDYISNKFKYKGLLKDFSDLIVNSDIYNSENKLVTNYEDLENQIFSVKKKEDFELVNQNETKISFKYFKKSILS